MRPQQQGRRQRSRGSSNNNNNNNNNSNRGRNQNPLSRSYESNGPDVKIRGNAQQIADKYETLASDAQSSGDRVVAENYLQHAEHYKRIIMAAQTQAREEQEQRDRQVAERQANEPNQDGGRDDNSRSQDNDSGDADNEEDTDQPEIKGTPAEVAHEASQQPAPEKPRRRRKAPASEDQADHASGEHSNSDENPPVRKRKRPAKKVEADANQGDEASGEAPTVDA